MPASYLAVFAEACRESFFRLRFGAQLEEVEEWIPFQSAEKVVISTADCCEKERVLQMGRDFYDIPEGLIDALSEEQISFGQMLKCSLIALEWRRLSV